MLVGPIVEDHPEKEGIGLDDLVLEKIVFHELNPRGNIRRYGVLGTLHSAPEVLDYKLKTSYSLGDCDANVPLRTSNINDRARAITDGGPWIAFGKQRGRDARRISERSYGACETLCHGRMRRVKGPHWLIRFLGQCPSLRS